MSNSFFVRLTLPENLTGEARDSFSAILPRVAGKFSFQGLEDWAVDVKNSRVLGAETEFRDLTLEGKRNREMRVYFASKTDAQKFGNFVAAVFTDLRVAPARALASKDWMKLWRKHYRIQTLREGRYKLAIVPAWKKSPTSGFAVRISPGQAFGTGTHATTQLCLKLLLRHGGEARVMDFGAGTGILAIAAERVYGSRGWAVESDPVALEQCRKNARLNRCRSLKFSRRMPAGKFDLIFANVLVPVLLEHRLRLHAALNPGALIFLSGILKSESAGFLRKFRAKELKVVEVLEQGDWSAIALRRIGGAGD